MLKKPIAQEVLAAALQNGGTFAEIFLEDTLINSLLLRNDTVETVSSGRKHGAGIRLLCRHALPVRIHQRYKPPGAVGLRRQSGRSRPMGPAGAAGSA